jgi:hypothetical protein
MSTKRWCDASGRTALSQTLFERIMRCQQSKAQTALMLRQNGFCLWSSTLASRSDALSRSTSAAECLLEVPLKLASLSNSGGVSFKQKDIGPALLFSLQYLEDGDNPFASKKLLTGVFDFAPKLFQIVSRTLWLAFSTNLSACCG